MNTKTETLAIVNQHQILLITGSEKMVPITPICEILGIDPKTQRDKIQQDEFLSSIGGLSPSVGADQKEREMFCIPLKYVFGWLFTINPKNVKPDAKEAVLKYRQVCYDVLFNHFAEQSEFLQVKAEIVDKEMDIYRSLQLDFKTAKDKMEESKRRVDIARKTTIEEWRANDRQIKLELN